MKIGFRVFLVLLTAVLTLTRTDVRAQDDAPARDDVPKIHQLLALSGGRILVLTTEKGGLYLSDSGGRGWRKAEGVPEVFVNRVSLAPGGRVYLATSEGLYTFSKGKWQKSTEGAFSGIFFNGDGSAAMLRYWGRGLHFLDARGMTAESLQAMQDAAARQAAMVSEEEELKRQMARLPRGDNATLDEKRAVMRVYTQWQDLEKRKEEAARETEAGMPVQVMGGLPEGAFVAGVIPWEGGWLAGVFGHGAFSLADGSRAWSSRQNGLPGPWVLTLEASPWGQAFAGFFGAGLMSLDPGSTAWKRVDGVPADCSVQAISFGSEGRVLVATRERGVLVSLDRGQTWAAGPGGNVQGVAVGTDGSLWAGLWEGGLRVSADGGVSWEPRPFAFVGQDLLEERGAALAPVAGHAPGSVVTSLAAGADGALFAGLENGMIMSTDGGRTWRRCDLVDY